MLNVYEVTIKQGNLTTTLGYCARNKKEAREKCKREVGKQKIIKVEQINKKH